MTIGGGGDGKSGDETYHCVVDGKKADATQSKGIAVVRLSPDGNHYAAVCTAGHNAAFVVIDGKKGQQYDGIWQPEIAGMFGFSPDSTKVAYVARSQNKAFVVVNEEESDAFEGSAEFRFSADGKHVAMLGRQNAPPPGGTVLYVDGKAQRNEKLVDFTTFTFSPDGSHYAYSGIQGVYLDGKPIGIKGRFVFSPDGKHLAVVGNRGSDRKLGIFVDGQLAGTGSTEARYCAFSADSNHLYWLIQQADSTPGAAPGAQVWATYADGKQVAATDRTTAAPLSLDLFPQIADNTL
jgi:hypothetical protein